MWRPSRSLRLGHRYHWQRPRMSRREHRTAYNLITIAENEFCNIVKNLNSGDGKKD